MQMIYTIAKAVLALVNNLTLLVNLFKERELKRAEKAIRDRQKAIEIINRKIEDEVAKDEPSDEELRNLHRRRNTLNNPR